MIRYANFDEWLAARHPAWLVDPSGKEPPIPLSGKKPTFVVLDEISTEESQVTQEIKADTSLYTTPADRLLAVAEVIKVLRAGKRIQTVIKAYQDWGDSSTDERDYQFDVSRFDYRVKPEPIVRYVNVYANGNLGGLFKTEGEARVSRLGPGRTVKMVEAQ